MASAYKLPLKRLANRLAGAAGAPHDHARSGWLNCTPETPWGVHGRIEEDRCTRCGWQA